MKENRFRKVVWWCLFVILPNLLLFGIAFLVCLFVCYYGKFYSPYFPRRPDLMMVLCFSGMFYAISVETANRRLCVQKFHCWATARKGD
ncbi:MAG TPA: hypothetical protein ENF20_02050 [Candidatus Marinimicrobia bacterium]|nr:hypothetical protein [Candidatus Neomarinimicrobiota bacterium]